MSLASGQLIPQLREALKGAAMNISKTMHDRLEPLADSVHLNDILQCLAAVVHVSSSAWCLAYVSREQRLLSYGDDGQAEGERALAVLKMVDSGFFRMEDKYRCFFCAASLKQIDADEDPLELHNRLNANCVFLKHAHSREQAEPSAAKADNDFRLDELKEVKQLCAEFDQLYVRRTCERLGGTKVLLYFARDFYVNFRMAGNRKTLCSDIQRCVDGENAFLQFETGFDLASVMRAVCTRLKATNELPSLCRAPAASGVVVSVLQDTDSSSGNEPGASASS